MNKRFRLFRQDQLTSKKNQDLVTELRQMVVASSQAESGIVTIVLAYRNEPLKSFGLFHSDKVSKIIKSSFIQSEVDRVLGKSKRVLVVVIEGPDDYDYVVIEGIEA